MAEYIDKDKLIDRFDELCNTICQYSKKQRAVMCSSCELGIAFDVVDDFPTEDVQPVKHGKWEVGDISYRYPSGVHYCSVCDYIDPFSTGSMHYCPNCGAKMDGEE